MDWLGNLMNWEVPPVVEPPVSPEMPLPEPPKLKLAYEAKPFTITQKWGVHAPEFYARFGFTDHNGLDIKHGINRRLRAPFDYQVYRTLWQPNGGGNVLTIVSRETYDSPHGEAQVMVDYLHLDKYLKTQGEGKVGDLLALAGSTGYSFGPHTHIQYRWVLSEKDGWKVLGKNKANNSFDPLEFYTGEYAVDLV